MLDTYYKTYFASSTENRSKGPLFLSRGGWSRFYSTILGLISIIALILAILFMASGCFQHSSTLSSHNSIINHFNFLLQDKSQKSKYSKLKTIQINSQKQINIHFKYKHCTGNQLTTLGSFPPNTGNPFVTSCAHRLLKRSPILYQISIHTLRKT